MSEMKNEKITPVAVERDENGYWVHPTYLALWYDNLCTSEQPFSDWAKANGMQIEFTELETDVDFCSQAGKRWFSKGYGDISEWNPSMPDGEGWFIVSIHDTGDGPVCLWMREEK